MVLSGTAPNSTGFVLAEQSRLRSMAAGQPNERREAFDPCWRVRSQGAGGRVRVATICSDGPGHDARLGGVAGEKLDEARRGPW
jgi:hypothetical protein